MTITLETDRFLLRPFQVADAPAFFEMNNDPEVMRYTGDVPFKSLEDCVQFIKNYNEDPDGQYKKYNMGRLTAIRIEDQAVIGWCGLKFHEKEEKVDLGYRLLQQYWGKGYATELAARCLKHAFEDQQLNQVIAHVHEENIGSQKVAERIGMKLDHRFLWEGKLPARFYKITKNEYQNRTNKR